MAPRPIASAYAAAHASIQKAAVIGAGAMGSGIAAQFANGGVQVTLLDLPAHGEDRLAIARAGVANQLKAGGFMRADLADEVILGTTEDLHLLADADMIIEAVIERLDVKQDLFRRVDAVRKAGSVVASNTSTIPRRQLIAGLGEGFARDFVITHFFNPPRHMRLVEIVGGPEVAPPALALAEQTCRQVLGKTVLMARDTPGFIANRIGCYWMAMAAGEAIAAGLDVEIADAILAGVAAVPRTGVFGLFDLVGIDLVPHVWGSLYAALPQGDLLHREDLSASPVFQDMLERKQFGRKTRAGFYRLAADRSREAWDYEARAYRAEAGSQRFGVDVLDRDDAEGQFARAVIAKSTAYAAAVQREIADSPEAVDEAMRLGYAWGLGPFELAAKVGHRRIVQWLEQAGETVPPLLLELASGTAAKAAKAAAPAPLIETPSAALLDGGEGVAVLQIRTKMNVFAPEVFEVIQKTVAMKDRFSAVVVTGAGARAFSAGADLTNFKTLIGQGDFASIDGFVDQGQGAFQALKYAPFPVVAAGFGLALGGGCEALLHCDAIVAHAELNAGLPETKVGLIPGWGGCALLLGRALDDGLSLQEAAERVFDTVFGARVSTSALDAAAMGVLRPGDQIVMNADDLLAVAKAKARSMAGAYSPPPVRRFEAGGVALRGHLLSRLDGREGLTDYDREIAGHLATVLSGGEASGGLTEVQMMALERQALVALSRNAKTRERIEHMLSTGKPMRN